MSPRARAHSNHPTQPHVNPPSHPSETTGTPRQRQSTHEDGPEAHAARKREAEDKANASKNNTASWAALGLGAAAAAAITAAALAAFVASDGAIISFTNIQQEKNTDGIVQSIPIIGGIVTSLVQTNNLEISWKVKKAGGDVGGVSFGIPSAVRVIKGDKIDISGVPELKINGTTPTVIKVKDDSTFVVDSKMSDVSKISIVNKGEGTIHTSFEDQLDQTVADTAGGIADTLGRTAGNFMNHIGTFIFLVIICVGLYFGIQMISKK
jgi:hypothetical protein